MPDAPSSDAPLDKGGWRRAGLDRRAATGPAEQHEQCRGWLRHGLDAVAAAGAGVVSLYLSRGEEPGTLDLAAELEKRGIDVLAPMLTDGRGHGVHEITWGHYRHDDLRDGLWGIPEPCGPALPASALASADLVICSALWVDRDGFRVGVGGGWYDRALPHRRPGAPVWAMVDSCEIVDAVPHDPWDIRVDAALTPAGLVRLGPATRPE
ncbi:5-formyltetrahydrofolate cyclo-ligase [Acidipropionibacterium acidipropionici]|uniref:5-formyltetrahydrofolate cyclo-ligase n=1 Tax=Acidipropionibacterium acidipropionici TaxID=1748 RepID=UPI0004866D57|nr:5-formyltetrahydrofolate cyclo-ligase [Acidipropionibacterium acidipropionici]APZ10312.1 5-formyltetrahydrofolate cyclo-ligase [Acidipropionibacterium acidipropionici]